MKPVQPVGFPDRWGPTPLWTLFRRVSRKANEGVALLSVYRDHGVVPRGFTSDNWNRIPEDLSAYQLVRPGDLVINKMKAWQGSLGVSTLLGVVSPAYFVYSPTRARYDARFLHHLLRSQPYIDSYGRMSGGIRVDQWDLDPWAFSRLLVPLPDVGEQGQIADFLDRETAQIDTLIEKQEELRQDLVERRVAMVNEAIATASGVPRTPFRNVADIQAGLTLGKSYSEETEEFPYLRVANVQTGSIDLSAVKTVAVPPEVARKVMLRAGDVLMTEGGDRAALGRGSLWNGEVDPCLHQNHVFAARPRQDRLLAEYLVYVLEAQGARKHFESTRRQTTNLSATNASLVRAFRFTLPSLADQRATVARLDSSLHKLGLLMTKTTRFIELARERRSALITAAVTGQLDISSKEAE